MEGKNDDQTNLIIGLFSKKDPMIITDPKGELDILKRNGYKVFYLDLANYKNGAKVTMLDERGKVDGTVGKDETDAG